MVVSIHSYRGGTGKSNLTANLAYLLAASGKRVAVVDTDIQSPGIHIIFNVDQKKLKYCLNDFLWRKCSMEDAAVKVEFDDPVLTGKLYLIPSSTNSGDIARILHDGYNVELLSDGFEQVCAKLALDFLFIDTHPGLNEETLLSLAVSDKLLVIMRPDLQDFEGSSITLQVASRLHVEDIMVVINKMPGSLDEQALRADVETAYGFPVAAILPHNHDLMVLGSKNLFTRVFPGHQITGRLIKLCDLLVESET